MHTVVDQCCCVFALNSFAIEGIACETCPRDVFVEQNMEKIKSPTHESQSTFLILNLPRCCKQTQSWGSTYPRDMLSSNIVSIIVDDDFQIPFLSMLLLVEEVEVRPKHGIA